MPVRGNFPGQREMAVGPEHGYSGSAMFLSGKGYDGAVMMGAMTLLDLDSHTGWMPSLAGSRGERTLQCYFGSRERAVRFARSQLTGRLTLAMQVFIGRMEMAWIATSGADSRCDCSFRAGPPGFVRVLGDRTLAYPDYRGNGVMASSGNLLENPYIGIWFGDFHAERIGLHVNGRATVVLPEQMAVFDPDLPEPACRGQDPTHWVVVGIEEAYVHCRKHLPYLVPGDIPRDWGTDSQLAKGGDPFGVAGSRALG
jgi:uncharacterized protein